LPEDVYDLKAALELFSALTRDSCKGRCGVGMERMFTELVTEVSRVLTLRSRIAQSIDNRKLQATVSAFTGGGIQMPEGFSNLGELLHLVRECLTHGKELVARFALVGGASPLNRILEDHVDQLGCARGEPAILPHPHRAWSPVTASPVSLSPDP
ncbi:hypothetical protein CYMTET_36359, partial [Cymbomonas tetramitiformis]